MFDLGDDMVLDGYRIPWLIWIQILIMFLLTLTILLTYFGFFAVDSSPTSGDSLNPSSPPRLEPSSHFFRRTQVVANHDDQEEISTSNRARGVENNSGRNGLLVKDLPRPETSNRFFHPCRYFDLAKQAFLKCLGLDSVFQTSPANSKEHED